ncbi:hypothetical protein TVAG_049650 [Trichomonas vaginalis G3]|uniref:Uncharacterized protein n=1 Tax=Trichomonas vaginalis (strain ATCC PRA-98 / G3) TaxID=412133 RepID=A2EVW0_TRIV3|nr:hypothetical protein TVAGG3_0548180 [Trichomonas vaginalis G3]EAY03181.1 hypothetical protein TVAG_049650 [Trichomonas vaginalis G3]KAI5520322.1 hypothetical protein TVAGG3_0548180 [Trichomonas vaginalis G3]|eukprot:XP_001315404.1 hypothetical protein [Trichomonas vaginalis G3]
MLEPKASEAAISAIAALQQRIRDLEKEREQLLKEKDHFEKHGFENIMRISEREMRCDQAQVVGNDIINYVNRIQTDVQNAKKKNRELKELLFNMEAAFPELSGNVKYSLRCKQEIKENSYLATDTLNDYQILLRDIIRIEPININDNIRTKLDIIDFSKIQIPDFVEPIIEELQSCPKNFKKISTKKQFKNVQHIFKARDCIRYITNRITFLSENAVVTKRFNMYDGEIFELYKGYAELYKEYKKFKV